jgi:hypothetical protein
MPTDESERRYPLVDFTSHVSKAENRESHLHKVKPLPDPNGNRAERRQASKVRRRKGR